MALCKCVNQRVNRMNCQRKKISQNEARTCRNDLFIIHLHSQFSKRGASLSWFRASALQAEGRGFESLSSHDRDHPKQDGFLCREHSSVGLERLLDKQEVSGSNPLVPTSRKAFRIRFGRLFCRHCGNATQEKDGYLRIRLLL